MSYGSNIRTIMIGDSSLNAAVDGIFYEHLPDNFDLTKAWVVYTFSINSQQDCLDTKNVFHTYDLAVRVICNDTNTRESLSDYITDYLNGNDSDGIQDIWFVNSSPTNDLEKAIYANTLSFSSFYLK